MYDILRDEYDIQVEFGDVANILAYISVGDRERDIDGWYPRWPRYDGCKRSKAGMMALEYLSPEVAATPQEAFYAETESRPSSAARGISARRA